MATAAAAAAAAARWTCRTSGLVVAGPRTAATTAYGASLRPVRTLRTSAARRQATEGGSKPASGAAAAEGAAAGKGGSGLTVSTGREGNTAVSTNVKKVIEATEKTFYGGVVIAGVVVLGVIGYAMFSQLLQSDGPYRLFNKTADLLQRNTQVLDLLGAPVKVSSGPARMVQYKKTQIDGKPGLAMQLHLQGARGEGLATVAFKENDAGRLVCHELYVDAVIQGRARRLILVTAGQTLGQIGRA